jgi:ribosomal protein S18 acetylase RimI-like enzyme
MNELDNPFYNSLRTRHARLAQSAGASLRYLPEYAPFLGVPDDAADHEAEIAKLIARGESVYLLGVAPHLSDAWEIEAFRPLAQMVCEAPLAVPDGPEIVPLDAAHRPDVLALTALVYPHYFRERTMEMGRYFGIYRDGRLAAMIGERLGTESAQEMSAICTHPDFLGRGYARRLTAMLTNETLRNGRLPFLHVSHENPRAKILYEQLGYRVRRDIPFWSLKKKLD